jgi:enoyl-CoA hydratase/carnithine racemase
MLYRDYSREEGQWIPNELGGPENFEAVDFLRELNETIRIEEPGCIVAAEESTAWPGVSRPVDEGGLGFTFKWNMGWMHDTLQYLAREPVHRRFHHDELTFAALYEQSERFIMPLSHDEVVHGKGSLLEKMPGDLWQKFANLRLLFTYQYTRPGKKLLFMGAELAPHGEWDPYHSLEWHLAKDPYRVGLARLLEVLGWFHLEHPARALGSRAAGLRLDRLLRSRPVRGVLPKTPRRGRAGGGAQRDPGAARRLSDRSAASRALGREALDRRAGIRRQRLRNARLGRRGADLLSRSSPVDPASPASALLPGARSGALRPAARATESGARDVIGWLAHAPPDPRGAAGRAGAWSGRKAVAYQHLEISKRGSVAVVSFDRAERLNALSRALMLEITHAANGFREDVDTRVVVFTGKGKHFSAGVDMRDPDRARGPEATRLRQRRATRLGPEMIRAVFEIEQITIAAVNGGALGGGACIATACDFRIGAHDSFCGYPEINRGMNLHWIALPLCVHLIGPSRAKRMIALGRNEDAETLLRWGFYDEVVEADRLMERRSRWPRTTRPSRRCPRR